MKGLLFHEQLEIRVDVAGEEFEQGDQVVSAITIKNRGGTKKLVDGPFLQLAVGDSKKLAQKSEKAVQILTSSELNTSFNLGPDEDKKIPWTFELDRNCPITDKSHSLYLLYGLRVAARAHLQLNVRPHAHIEGVLTIFETSFQFDPRGMKSRAGWVVATLKPPASRRFTVVEALELGLRFEGEKLFLHYTFKVKGLEAGPMTLEIKKKKIELTRELVPGDYMSSAGFVDSALLEPKIEEALCSVLPKNK